LDILGGVLDITNSSLPGAFSQETFAFLNLSPEVEVYII